MNFEFGLAVMDERARQVEKGYDAAHDDAHGIYHLLALSQHYALKEEWVKAQALVLAAQEYLTRNKR